MNRLLTGVVLGIACAVVTTGCIRKARNLGREIRVTPEGQSSAPMRPPMDPSDEATGPQLQLAREQGIAVDAAVEQLLLHARGAHGEVPAGEFLIAYVVTPARGAWKWQDGTLAWKEPSGSVYLGVVIRDGADRRVVPGLTVRVKVLDEKGSAIAEAPLTYRWDPLVEQYGANFAIPDGTYSFRIEIEPPSFRRHDPANGDRYASPTLAELWRVPVSANPPLPEEPASREDTLRLARAQGDALLRAFYEMAADTATDGASVQRGDVIVAYAVEFSEPFWVLQDGALLYYRRPEQSAETNAHVEVAVLDAQTRRFLPELTITATLVDEAGEIVGTHAQPFMWHPWLYHYGENWRIPSAGRYRLRVHVEPPRWPRMDRELGRRFTAPLDVEFTDVKLLTGQK